MFLEEGGLKLPPLGRVAGHGVKLDHRVAPTRNVAVVHAEIGG